MKVFPWNPINPRNYELGQLVSTGYQVFDDTWSTYIPEHKSELCSKIVRHYFFYEIGQDTPDKFKLYLNETLERIMPFYNQLYKSELIKFDPIMNHLLETNGRSIENVLRKAQKGDSEVISALENFAKSSKGITNSTQGTKQGITETENYKRDYTENKERTENETTGVNRKLDATVTRDGTTDTTTNETVAENQNGDKRFADTPQTTVGDNPNNAYMTNFTKESQTRDTTTNATSNSTIHQTDETDETETTDTDRKLNGTEDTVGNITDERTKTSQLNRDVDTKATNDGFENGSSSQDTSKAKQTLEDESQTTDEGKHEIISGFMNMTPSQLLQGFRETFLNIDEQIIKELQYNFMEVF